MRIPVAWGLTVFIAAVWLVNGLWAKLLQAVPRHQQIVGTISGEAYAPQLTALIGAAEVLMALWVLSRWQLRVCTWLQVALVATMNVLEAWLAKPLLLFGYVNLLWAFLFVIVLLLHQRLWQRHKSSAA